MTTNRLRPFVVTLLLALATSLSAAESKPNVLFIISDDLNNALSGFGHPECKTPNLDALAKTGTSFTRAFCQYPICGPSRASIMTGQYPEKNGVTGNGGKVKPDRITLPRHFKNNGYWTARVSKIYHMGIPSDAMQGTNGTDHPESWTERYNVRALETLTPGKLEELRMPELTKLYPQARKEWLAARDAGKAYVMPKTLRGDYAIIETEDSDDLLPDGMAVTKAIELLQSRAGEKQPFFLAVGLLRPHFPFVSPANCTKLYKAEDMTIPDVAKDEADKIPSQERATDIGFSDDQLRRLHRGYYGAVTYMDRQVGRLLAELDRLKLRDNTIVVFVSDHGYLIGEHYAHKKHRLWEEAIRTPLIISVPGKKTDAVCNHPVELLDLYPTLANLADLPADPGTQGQSLTKILDDPNAKLSRPDVFTQTKRNYCLRTSKWAYMWYTKYNKHKKEGFMLYDMSKDPKQHRNLADNPEYATIRKQLHERLMTRIADARK